MITYEINETRTRLTLIADDESRESLREVAEEQPDWFGSIESEVDAFEYLICNSELSWLSEQEGFYLFGDLTDAPCLCIRDEDGIPVERWGYMNYQIKSFLDDFIKDGRAVFVNQH